MNLDLLKYLDCSTIISEIKESRKGISLIVFLICVLFGFFDFLFLRKMVLLLTA